jgi:hypothetical protein
LKLTNSYLFNELKLKGSLIPIGVVCLLAYIAKLAYGSVIGGATDDFILISEGLNFDYSFYVSQGRWAVAFISTLLAPLELDYIGGKNLFGIIYAIQIAFSMLILIRFLNSRTGKYFEIILLGIATLHPYLGEIFTYRHATMINSLSFSYPAMAVGYILLYNKRYRLLGIPLIIWALSGYQVVFSMIMVFIPIQILSNLLKGRDITDILKKMAIPLGLLVGTLLLYVLTNRFILNIMDIPASPRSAFLGLGDLNVRFTQILTLAQRTFISNEAIALSVPKWILLALLLSLLVTILAKKNPSKKYNMAKILCIPLLLISAIGIIGPAMLLDVWWSTPRVLSNIGFFWALVLLLFIYEIGEKKALLIPLGLVLLSFIYSNNRILADQQRMNFLDFHKSNRIVVQLEQIDGFQEKRILFFRENEIIHSHGPSTKYMDLNISALYPGWSRLSMLEYVSGYRFTPATTQDEITIKEKHKTLPSFPSKGSIFCEGEIIVIQL